MDTPYPKPEPRPPKKRVPLKRSPLKRNYKPTGELSLMKTIHAHLKGKCELTGAYLPFDVKNFVHVLSKGSRPDLRLNRMNIIHATFDFHYLYDNSSKEKTLKAFPQAEYIYDLKQKLKSI